MSRLPGRIEWGHLYYIPIDRNSEINEPLLPTIQIGTRIMGRFFVLECKGESHGQIDRRSIDNAVASWACRECQSLLPGHKMQDVHLRAKAPMGSQPLMGSFALYVAFARRPFLEVVSDGDIERHFHWAFVLGPDGKPQRDWLIAVGHRQTVLRGTEQPIHNYCPACGALRYATTGGYFLYPEPPQDTDVFDAGAGRFVVTEAVMRRVAERQWNQLSVSEIGVASSPLDGIDALPTRMQPS